MHLWPSPAPSRSKAPWLPPIPPCWALSLRSSTPLLMLSWPRFAGSVCLPEPPHPPSPPRWLSPFPFKLVDFRSENPTFISRLTRFWCVTFEVLWINYATFSIVVSHLLWMAISFIVAMILKFVWSFLVISFVISIPLLNYCCFLCVLRAARLDSFRGGVSKVATTFQFDLL